MVDITLSDITEGSNTLNGTGYFDQFMQATRALLKEEFNSQRIKPNEYATVYLGSMQKNLEEAIKFAIGRQLASAQAEETLEQITKLKIDEDLVRAEIRNKDANTANLVTENNLILERITNLEKDTLIKIQEELLKKKEIILMSARIDKILEDIEKTKADIRLVNQTVQNKISENFRIVEDTKRITASTAKILEDTKLVIVQRDKLRADIDLVLQEIEVKAKEVQLMIARISKMAKEEDKIEADIDMVYQRIKHNVKEIEKLTQDILVSKENIVLTQARTKNVLCETNKCGTEINLLKEKVKTERANTDASIIGNESILDNKNVLYKAQAATEQANTDPSVVSEGSLIDERIRKAKADANRAKADYNPVGIVVSGSKLDCEARLACARVETEKANFVEIGGEENQVHPDSFLGARASLTIAQAETEKANTKANIAEEGSLIDARIDKMIADANTQMAQYDPSNAGVTEGSKLDCEAKLTCARIESEKANFTPIGDDENEISPTSLLGAKADFLHHQALTEKANIDGSIVKEGSVLAERIAKMKADAISAEAQYDTTNVKENSILDCTAKLKCAQAKSESANYTEVGDDESQIPEHSYLGARTLDMEAKRRTEEANTDSSVIGTDSMLDVRRNKIDAENKNLRAKYDPTDLVIEGSMLDAETKLTAAKVRTEEVNYTPIGTNEGDVNPDSLLGARGALIQAQVKSETSNFDPKDVKEGSMYRAKIDKMEADSLNAIAAYNPELAGVQENSLLDCSAKLKCAEVESEKANYTEVGTDEGQINPKSLLGARASLIIEQTKSENANTDGTNLKPTSFLASKIDKMKADSIRAKADYDKSVVGEDSILDCTAKLKCAQAISESANYTKVGTQTGEIEPESLLGQRTLHLKAQTKTEKANTDGSVIESGSMLDSRKTKVEVESESLKAKYQPTGIVESGSMIDAETKLTSAKVRTEAVNYTPIGEGEGEVDPTSLLGSRGALIQAQVKSETSNFDPKDVKPNSLYEARIRKMDADARSQEAVYDPDSAGVKEGSKIDCESKLTCVKIDTEKAQTQPVGNEVNQISPDSLIGARADLIRKQAKTEEANTDPTAIEADSYMQAKIDKMRADATRAKAEFDNVDVKEGSLLDCSAKLKCAQATSESANYTKVGEGNGEIDAESYLGSRTLLNQQQVLKEKADIKSIAVKDDKTKEEILSIKSKFAPTGIVETGSTVDCEQRLLCAKVETEKANFTSIGDEQDDIPVDSLVGARANLLKAQAETEIANVDASGIKKGSMMDARIDKMQSDARNAKATYAPIEAGVEANSKLSCETDLACAKALSESANYTPIGDDEGEISSKSLLGARAELLHYQALDAKSNTDGSEMNSSSYNFNKIKKMQADANNALAEYDPETAGVKKGSKLDNAAYLLKSQARRAESEFTEIGNDPDQIDPTSLIGAKASLTIAQAATERAEIDPSEVEEGSMMDAKIKKMKADSNNSLAQYNPEEAGVQKNSKLDCEARLFCAKADVELAQLQPIGTGAGTVNPDSILGHKITLSGYQSDTEKANTDGSDVGSDSYIKAKIDKMKADAIAARARFDKSVVESGSILDGETDLVQARVLTELANTDDANIDPESLIGAKVQHLLSQKEAQDALKAKYEADAEFQRASYVKGVAEDGTKINCEAKLFCAKAGETLARYTAPIDENGKPIPLPRTTLMGAEALVMEAKIKTELANTEDVEGGLVGSRIKLANVQGTAVEATYDKELVGADSAMDGETRYKIMQAKSLEAKFNDENVTEGSLFAAERDLAVCKAKEVCARTEAPPAGSILEAQLDLIKAQIDTEKSKSVTSPSEGSVNGAQKSLYEAQSDHLYSDSNIKSAKIYADAWTMFMTQDIENAGVYSAADALPTIDDHISKNKSN